MTNLSNYLGQNQWLLHIVLLCFGLVVALLFLSRTRKHLLPRLEKTSHSWDSTLLEAIYLPLRVVIFGLSFVLLFKIAALRFVVLSGLSSSVDLLKKLIVILSLFWFVIRYISAIEKYLLYVKMDVTRKRDRTSVRAIAQLSRVILVILIFLILLQLFGYRIDALLAFGGVGALAVSFAAKDTLANFFGGMMIFWDKPFSVGDWVRSPDRDIEGTVDHIGWRLTRIITFEQRPLYVPNSLFSSISVENPSRMTHRRIKADIGLRYDDSTKVALILQDVEKMLREHPDIDATQILMVKLFEFGASSLNFFIYTFTKTTDWVTFQSVQQDVFLKAIDIIHTHGAECAFPTTTLHVPDPVQTRNTTR